MFMVILAILLLMIGVVFLISAVIMGKNVKRARTPRGKKLLKRRCRNTAILTAIFLIIGIILLVQALLSGSRQSALEGDVGYDLAGTYKTRLASGGENKAYLYLPSSVYGADNTVSLRNERGEWFEYEETENSKGDTVMRWINRGKQTIRYQQLWLLEEAVMTIQLGLDGRLYAEGTFPYMKYDNERETYSGLLAEEVSDFFCNGNTLFYLTDQQQLYAVGFNKYGQMGDGTNQNCIKPQLLAEDIVSLSCSSTHTLMVDTFGNLYTMGDNSDSQLGDGTMTNSNTPIRIMSGVDSVAAGNYFSVILAQNGDVYTCGRSTLGQCGNGTKNGTAKPTKIAGGAIKVVATHTGAAYMTEEGKVYVWGENANHRFSADNTPFFNTPTAISENAYDIALTDSALIILNRERDVVVTGELRPVGKNFTESILSMNAKVPEDFVSPVQKEEKPDISELGKDQKK